MRSYFTCLVFLLLASSCMGVRPFAPYAGEVSNDINLNQIGYAPEADFRFSVITRSGIRDTLLPQDSIPQFTTYYLTDTAGTQVLGEGQLGEVQDWTRVAGVYAYSVTTAAPPAGSYRLYVPGKGFSHAFEVKSNPYAAAFRASIHSNYLQRASMELTPEFAGEYARPAGHPDTAAIFHPSSGRTGKLSSPGGWYDAGDFNKYIVNGAFPMGQYLTLYEDIGDPFPDGTLNIPESGNGQSDYLDELKYELDWMLTMQDEDGGLFHKLTTLNFEGMVMPHEATNQRYVVGKSTTATLDFAGAAAQASRVFRPHNPAFADQLLAASERAWEWAATNPEDAFTNPTDVSTGQYGDSNWDAENTFAAAELLVTTNKEKYFRHLQDNPPNISFREGETWNGFMAHLGVFSILRDGEAAPREYAANLQRNLLEVADSLVAVIDTSAYHQPVNRFVWGSNSDLLNGAMVLAAAYEHSPKSEYLEGVRACVDYIFGHNPMGVSYLTGGGDKTPMFIHHRASLADDIEQPIPGLLSGGPNLGQQDAADTSYPRYAAPMQSWADQGPSYASNEICLNWNAPLTYVLGWLGSKE